MQRDNIQLFRLRFAVDECLKEIRECLEIGWTGIGFKTTKIEEAWSTYTGLRHSHFINSNTAGLHLALNILKRNDKFRDGNEIITTPFTFVSTNHAILYENLTPVFADIDEFLCLDPKSVESRITEKTRAIIFFGFGGNAGKLDEIVSIAKKHNLRLILDAAHMAGTNYKGKHVGQAAGCTVFSFQAVKNLPTADSGMICFQDQDLDAQVRQMSWLGIDKDTFSRSSNLTKGNYKWLYDVNQLGFKYHGNSIMAAIALVQLKYLDDDNARRKEISTYYENRLSNNKHVVLIPMSEGTDSCHHLFQIRVDAAHRNYLLEYLNSKQISPGVHYRVNTDYTMYSSWKGKCPKAEKVSEEILSFFANSHDAYR